MSYGEFRNMEKSILDLTNSLKMKLQELQEKGEIIFIDYDTWYAFHDQEISKHVFETNSVKLPRIRGEGETAEMLDNALRRAKSEMTQFERAYKLAKESHEEARDKISRMVVLDPMEYDKLPKRIKKRFNFMRSIFDGWTSITVR